MGAHEEVRPVLPMPIHATPYQHQIEAFNFACGLFGLLEGGGLDGTNSMFVLRQENQEETKPD